ncbi:probable glycosyltransferase At5g20260 [Euphorbia lathyris]|uniref:probable glycosyltransferase At5g20260 n=1 Tax=Euphorbia lathyris TaxID=212925 RepID=UPI00331418BE
MGQEFRYYCRVETWRLLGVLGMMFVVIITFQHFQLPSGNILSSMSSIHIDQIAENQSLLTNRTLSKSGSSNAIEKDQDVNSDRVAEGNVVLTNSFDIDSHEIESLLQQTVEPPVQSVVHPDHDEIIALVPEGYGQKIPPENINHAWEKTTTSDVNDTDILSEENLGPKNSSGVGNLDNNLAVEEAADRNSTLYVAEISDDIFEQEEREENFLGENSSSSSEIIGVSTAGVASPVLFLPPVDPSPNLTIPRDVESKSSNPVADVGSNASFVDRDVKSILEIHGKSGELQSNNTKFSKDKLSRENVPKVKQRPKMPTSGVISVSEMNNLLRQSWSSPNIMKPQWTSAVDRELLHTKSQVESATALKNDPILHAPLYWNVSMFRRSYELMEDMLKVYIYKEGEKPILHQPVLKGIYASEGWFMKLLEGSKKFVTKNPRKAHLFYLPFSSRNLELQLYVPDSHSHKNLIRYLKNYLDMIVAKYPFWNRTQGADHFLVACHDWAPSETRAIMSNCIRALCNSDVKEDFVFGKDVSLPETNVRTPQNPLRDLGGKPASQRPILAFFAGGMHGYVRPILLKHWGNKDPDMKIYSRMPKKSKGKMNYPQHMKSSKYCICPRGYEVNSPRIVEAIMYDCVPVIISDNYVPPFFEVLNWESFAVFVLEKDIPNLKNILLSIPESRYREMQMRVKKVQHHFLWHARPVKYDLFHMILHSVWYNRVFQMQP